MKNGTRAYLFMITTVVISSLLVSSSASAAEKKKEWKLAKRLCRDNTAKEVGDILTIIIEEEAEATTDAKSSSSKKTAMGGKLSAGHPNTDGGPTSWTNASVPSWSVDANRSFEGGGSAANKDKLETKMAAFVMEVLPNGNLLVEGKRSIIIQEETVQVVLSGTLRPSDIARDNTVKSSVIADASIKYLNSGPISKNQKRGLFTKLWNWINPF